jgi:Polyketide cyclase / dehydrase and lipid transport
MSGVDVDRPILSHSDETTLTVTADRAWDSFKVFDAIDAWHPATENCSLLVGKNAEPLAVREFGLKGGGFVISELLDYDEARHWFRYRILKTNLPLANYVGEMWVEPAAQGATVKWSATFQRPAGSRDPEADDRATEALVQGVFSAGLEHLHVVTGG